MALRNCVFPYSEWGMVVSHCRAGSRVPSRSLRATNVDTMSLCPRVTVSGTARSNSNALGRQAGACPTQTAQTGMSVPPY